MGLVVFGEREAGTQVLLEQGALGVLDILDECLIHGLLDQGTLSVHELLLGALHEESLCVGLLGLVVSGEHLVGDTGDINAGGVDLGAGGQGVHLIDAFEGHAVDPVGAGHQEQAGLELLEEDDALAAEAAAEEYEHGAGFDTLAELSARCFLCSELSLLVLCGVPLELFDH